MIKYFVRTTGERTLDESFSQIEYELLVDNEHNSGKAFLQQLLIINDYDSVLMEDDIILCKNFKQKIEEIISQHREELINFFTRPNDYISSSKTMFFCYNQCTYFPKGFAKVIYDTITKYHLEDERQELMMRFALRKLKIFHFVYRPCLVQHIDKGSLMGHHTPFSRRSPFFIDYLEQLGIDYKYANLNHNRLKLIKLMKEKFEEIDNK